jgi:hypothetical protein
MVNATSNVTQTQPVAQSTKPSTQKPTQPEPKSVTITDSVQLSKAGQAMLAAVQESIETPAQTAKEARGGDLQAQRVLAKEAASKSVAK